MYFYLKTHDNLDKVTKVTLISKARGISIWTLEGWVSASKKSVKLIIK